MSAIQSNYAGLSTIERLMVTGQFEKFQKALKKNKEAARKILESLKIDQISIEQYLKG